MRAANSLIVDVMRPEICNAQIAKHCVQPAHIREDCTETKKFEFAVDNLEQHAISLLTLE